MEEGKEGKWIIGLDGWKSLQFIYKLRDKEKNVYLWMGLALSRYSVNLKSWPPSDVSRVSE